MDLIQLSRIRIAAFSLLLVNRYSMELIILGATRRTQFAKAAATSAACLAAGVILAHPVLFALTARVLHRRQFITISLNVLAAL